MTYIETDPPYVKFTNPDGLEFRATVVKPDDEPFLQICVLAEMPFGKLEYEWDAWVLLKQLDSWAVLRQANGFWKADWSNRDAWLINDSLKLAWDWLWL